MERPRIPIKHPLQPNIFYRKQLKNFMNKYASYITHYSGGIETNPPTGPPLFEGGFQFIDRVKYKIFFKINVIIPENLINSDRDINSSSFVFDEFETWPYKSKPYKYREASSPYFERINHPPKNKDFINFLNAMYELYPSIFSVPDHLQQDLIIDDNKGKLQPPTFKRIYYGSGNDVSVEYIRLQQPTASSSSAASSSSSSALPSSLAESSSALSSSSSTLQSDIQQLRAFCMELFSTAYNELNAQRIPKFPNGPSSQSDVKRFHRELQDYLNFFFAIMQQHFGLNQQYLNLPMITGIYPNLNIEELMLNISEIIVNNFENMANVTPSAPPAIIPSAPPVNIIVSTNDPITIPANQQKNRSSLLSANQRTINNPIGPLANRVRNTKNARSNNRNRNRNTRRQLVLSN